MREEVQKELDEKQRAALAQRDGYLDAAHNYMFAAEVARRLDITEKTLGMLAKSGEFDMGRLGLKAIVDVASLRKYLDRCHFTKRLDRSQDAAVDGKGKIKYELTYHPVKHTDIPELHPIDGYAAILGFDKRTFIHHCDIGTITHYRIGAAYKISEADWRESLYRTSKNQEAGVGRPSKVRERMSQLADAGENAAGEEKSRPEI